MGIHCLFNASKFEQSLKYLTYLALTPLRRTCQVGSFELLRPSDHLLLDVGWLLGAPQHKGVERRQRIGTSGCEDQTQCISVEGEREGK